MSQKIEEMQEHPEGCMCVDCRIERDEVSEEELDQISNQYPEKPLQSSPPPPPPPPQHRQRQTVVTDEPPIRVARPRKPRKTHSEPQQIEYPNTYTQPIRPPNHPHARYEYSYGEMRRCHLCGAIETHMNYENGDEPTWFASLEDRARHILEVHTDASNEIIKRERSRAKEILGIKDLWDGHSQVLTAEIGRPVMEERYAEPRQAKKPFLQSLFGSKKPKQPSKPNWFMEHKIVTIIIVIALLYGIYCYYLVTQGYEF